MLINLTSKNFAKDKSIITKSNKTGFILFKANWCGHCKAFLPVYRELSAILGDNFDFYVVECIGNDELCNSFDITSYPTLRFVRKSKIGRKYNGSRTKQDLISALIDERCKV